jgi:hypothetical protein
MSARTLSSAPEEVMSQRARAPIFIVGCQRSGTTLLRLILDSHPAISCGPETRFLPDLARITTSDWKRISRYGFDRDYWLGRVAEFFGGFQDDYARARGKSRWADKTPMYALSIGYLDELFPQCQIVHVIRDGRDVVASHRQHWGYQSALRAVPKWPHYVRTARQAGTVLPSDRYFEVRYEDMVTRSEQTLRTLFSWLGENWDPSVLDFDRRPHDVGDRYSSLTQSRRTGGGASPIYGSRVGAHKQELDPALRLLTATVAGPMLRELGYS